jgi:hypothetical protein
MDEQLVRRQEIAAELSASIMAAALMYSRAGGTKGDFLTLLRAAFEDAAVAVGDRW